MAMVTTGGVAYAMQPTNAVETHNEKSIVASIEPPKTNDTPKVEQEPVVVPETAPVAVETVANAPAPAVAPVQDNETIVWNFLIANGFTRNQTAGIMGNLQQEHNFQTDGDGLAQWTQGRRAALYAKPNPNDINTQLAFLMEELNGPYVNVQAQIKMKDEVSQAAIIFQNQFERCDPNYCMLGQRISYAYAILARH